MSHSDFVSFFMCVLNLQKYFYITNAPFWFVVCTVSIFKMATWFMIALQPNVATRCEKRLFKIHDRLTLNVPSNQAIYNEQKKIRHKQTSNWIGWVSIGTTSTVDMSTVWEKKNKKTNSKLIAVIRYVKTEIRFWKKNKNIRWFTLLCSCIHSWIARCEPVATLALAPVTTNNGCLYVNLAAPNLFGDKTEKKIH